MNKKSEKFTNQGKAQHAVVQYVSVLHPTCETGVQYIRVFNTRDGQ